jgi:hypothetical protein
MTEKNYYKDVKKANDKLFYYDSMILELKKLDKLKESTKVIFLEYISTAVFQSLFMLRGNDRKKYKKEIQDRKIIKNIKVYNRFSLKEIIKKIIYKMMIL